MERIRFAAVRRFLGGPFSEINVLFISGTELTNLPLGGEIRLCTLLALPIVHYDVQQGARARGLHSLRQPVRLSLIDLLDALSFIFISLGDLRKLLMLQFLSRLRPSFVVLTVRALRLH